MCHNTPLSILVLARIRKNANLLKFKKMEGHHLSSDFLYKHMHDFPFINYHCSHMKSFFLTFWMPWIHAHLFLYELDHKYIYLWCQDSVIELSFKLFFKLFEGRFCIVKNTLDLQALLKQSPCVSLTEYQLWNHWFNTVQMKYLQWEAWETGKNLNLKY